MIRQVLFFIFLFNFSLRAEKICQIAADRVDENGYSYIDISIVDSESREEKVIASLHEDEVYFFNSRIQLAALIADDLVFSGECVLPYEKPECTLNYEFRKNSGTIYVRVGFKYAEDDIVFLDEYNVLLSGRAYWDMYELKKAGLCF